MSNEDTMSGHWATEIECGFQWESDTQPGPHSCRKPSGHVTDITNDDHRCCCGENTWSDE